MSNSTEVSLVAGEVAIHEGGSVQTFTSNYVGASDMFESRPIVKAVIVARLRALADVIESAPSMKEAY